MKRNALILLLISGVLLSLSIGVRAVEAAPRLIFSPSSGSYNVNEEFKVTVNANSETELSQAVDAWGKFDSSKLEVVSVVKATSPAFAFPDLVPEISNTSGTFNFSCSPSDMNSFSAKAINGPLAVITFKAKATGTAVVSFDCTAGSGVDSNIYNTALNDVINCSESKSATFTINSGSGDSPTNTPTTATSSDSDSDDTTTTSSSDTESELPRTGGVGSTVGLIAFGLVSVLGAVFLRFL